MTEFDVIEKDFDLLFDCLSGVLSALKCLLALSLINIFLIGVFVLWFLL